MFNPNPHSVEILHSPSDRYKQIRVGRLYIWLYHRVFNGGDKPLHSYEISFSRTSKKPSCDMHYRGPHIEEIIKDAQYHYADYIEELEYQTEYGRRSNEYFERYHQPEFRKMNLPESQRVQFPCSVDDYIALERINETIA